MHIHALDISFLSFLRSKYAKSAVSVGSSVFSEKIGLVKLHACNIIAEESLSKRIWVETEILKYYDHWEGEGESIG